ncbi:MAG: hypothetical protein JEZ08_20475 [Clostridiales bacterium]|nr:hypothetical protein [Clostridiales bacterium]
MNITTINLIIDELIELSDTKYGFLKVGKETLNTDILFIEKYSKLKELLGTETFEEIDFTEFPKMKILKEMIVKINQTENNRQKRNVRMTKATSAYQKK